MSRLRLDPTSPTGVSAVAEPAPPNRRNQANGYVVNKATGLITAGTNVTLAGNGTPESPYVVNAAGSSGGLLAANNLSDLASIATARTNLGLGAVALLAGAAGSNKQLQYNNNGPFAGAAVYWDDADTRLGVNSAVPGETLDVKGNFQVKDADTATKEYRFRTSGGNLDVDFSGADGFISVFSGANYSGTQRNKLRLEAGAEISHAIGQWQFSDGPFGGANATVDGITGIGTFKTAAVSGGSGVMTMTADSDGGEYNIGVNASGTLALFGAGANSLNLNLLDGSLSTGGTQRLANDGSLTNIASTNMANVGSTPGTPTGGGIVYVEAGALKYKGSSGTVTVLAPA